MSIAAGALRSRGPRKVFVNHIGSQPLSFQEGSPAFFIGIAVSIACAPAMNDQARQICIREEITLN
jgi:hypothetical protein